MLARIRRLAPVIAVAVPLLAAPSAWGLPDFDGDGVGTGDCAPADPAVFPGAVDRPDLAFEDVNCDGIDGDAASAVFVAQTGDDGAPGTREAPKQTIGAALAAGREVYVAAGSYPRVDITGEAGIYGGYATGSWTRSRANATTIGGAPEAILARGATVTLQLLELRGGDGAGSAYGLRAVNGSRVALSNVVATGVDARGGQPGAQPPPAAAGAQGVAGGCPTPGATGGTGDSAGGLGGTGGAGSNATGSPGARGQSPTGVAPALGGPPGMPGEDGRPIDAPGDAGGNTGFTLGGASEVWNGGAGAAGKPGIDGTGGGGGGGGTGGAAQTAPGAGGGGGGGGGQGSRGSPGGASGGGSFGAYLHASSLVATDSRLVAGRGGNGGDGGIGGVGGAGGDGGPGSPSSACPGGAGGRGGEGGPGAPGGPGGAGPGGPSIGVFRVGAGALYTARTGTAEQADAAGAGGLRPGVGDRADGGVARPTETANGAPETGSGDFDGDGVADAADNCPEIAAPGGCPNRPPRLPDADGDQIPDRFDACPAVPRGNDPNEDGCPDGPAPPPPPASAPSPPAPIPPPRARPARVSAAVAFRFSNRGRSTVFSSLQVRGITGGATVVVRCAGKGCPVKRFIKRRAAGTLSLRPFVRKRLRAGIALRVRVTRSGFVGLALDVAIRARRAPRVTTLCLPPGASRPQRC